MRDADFWSIEYSRRDPRTHRHRPSVFWLFWSIEFQNIVFHDAFQYFERRYQLNSIGFVASHTGYGTSVRKLIEVRKAIKKKKIRCIFSEPQFSPKLVQTVIEGTSVKKGMLDPLGTGLKPGKELYFTLLINLSRSLRKCLL